MAKKQQNDNVAQLPTRCAAESCSQKTSRMNFCDEHFLWFKEGLINKEGKRPTDFDKKFMAFRARQKTAA